MSFLAARNAIGIGLGGIISFLVAEAMNKPQGNLLCENGNNLVQENGGLILLE